MTPRGASNSTGKHLSVVTGHQAGLPGVAPPARRRAGPQGPRQPPPHRQFEEQLRLMVDEPDLRPVVSVEEIKRLVPRATGVNLSHQQFNRLLLYHAIEPVTKEFFERYFRGSIPSLNAFKDCVAEVRKACMLYFGNFKRGFHVLSRSHEPNKLAPRQLIARSRPLEPFTEIQDVPLESIHLLGYAVDSPGEANPDQKARVKDIGKANTERYLSMEAVDIYIAASMRTAEDFRAGQSFISEVFQNPDVAPLNLTYFNPLVSYLEDPVQKGLFECLMLKLAKVMIYLAGLEDTYGKDCELATMLQQGKQPIVYVPREDQEGNQDRYERRAELFHKLHPLSFQVDLSTGVAHGVIVVRSALECAVVLSDLFSSDGLRTEIHDDDAYNHFLVERRTGSRIRVVTKNPYLTTAFWSRYLDGP